MEPKLTIVDALADNADGLIDPAVLAEVTNYDADTVDKFLDLILTPSELDEGEEFAFWRCPIKIPRIGYPVNETVFFNSTLSGSFKASSRCYIGTSTLALDSKGMLRNRKENVVKTRMIVLDDIGTKIPVAKIKLPPTYIIESSAGNFQYGYVFSTPIDKISAADELLALIYDAGLSDSGGKMANKLVRLPCGVNGKDSPDTDKTLFPVTLIESNPDNIYTPQELLDGLGVEGNWEAMYTDARHHAASMASSGIGATLWTAAVAPSLEGVVDPVFEYLIEEGEYLSDDPTGFATVICPNAHAHTDGSVEAGYRPLGRGNMPTTRAFRCLHDHCGHITTRDFLAHVAANGGPEAGVRDDAAGLTADWVYDANAHGVWKVRQTPYPRLISMEAFKTLHPHKVRIVRSDGREDTKSAQHQLWYFSKSRVNACGHIFDPSNTSRLVDIDGERYVNTYSPPNWGDGPIDKEHLNPFLSFLEYLTPIDEEREYFLDWLACKAQDMGFRGCAIVMVADQQGTGRGTLADMLASLFGVNNLTNQPFATIVGESSFNEWQESPIVVTDETLNTGETNFFHTYERLKELIDPRPKMTTINPKYGRKRNAFVYSSYLMFSNHSAALALGKGDRRFFVMSNTKMRETAAYFESVNKWMTALDDNNRPVWCASVWRWLLARKVDVAEMLAPPKDTAAKAVMAESAKSAIDILVEATCKSMINAGSNLISLNHVYEAADRHASLLGLTEIKNWRGVVKRKVREQTLTLPYPIKIDGKSVRVRLIRTALAGVKGSARRIFTHPGGVVSDGAREWINTEKNAFIKHRDEGMENVGDMLDAYDI